MARCARLRAPGAFGASGTSDPHAIISSCSLLIHHARLLAHSTAGDAASGRAGASGASSTFLSMQVCRRSGASHARLLARSGAAVFGRTAAAAPLAAPAAPLSAAFGRTAVLPNPASLASDDASAARLVYPPTDAGFTNDPLK